MDDRHLAKLVLLRSPPPPSHSEVFRPPPGNPEGQQPAPRTGDTGSAKQDATHTVTLRNGVKMPILAAGTCMFDIAVGRVQHSLLHSIDSMTSMRDSTRSSGNPKP